MQSSVVTTSMIRYSCLYEIIIIFSLNIENMLDEKEVTDEDDKIICHVSIMSTARSIVSLL